jgi:hypothetical protein
MVSGLQAGVTGNGQILTGGGGVVAGGGVGGKMAKLLVGGQLPDWWP